MIISVNAQKTFDEIYYTFMIKTLSKIGIKGNVLNWTKNNYKTPTANITVNGEKFDISHKIRYKASLSPLITVFQHCTESPIQ